MNLSPILFLALLLPVALRAETPGNRILTDIAYKTGSDLSEYETERCKLDVYRPALGADLPVLIWFHGGGLKGGDKQGTPTDGVKPWKMTTSLAREGMIVVSPNYRFSPQVKFPAYLDDAAAAVAWAKKNLGEKGADTNRIFIGGHSAGGWIAFMLGLDPQYLEKEGIALSEIAGVIPVSGQTVTHSTVRGERGFGRYAIVADEAAPLHHIRKNTPPMLVIYADKDMTGRADENELFIEMIKGAGNKGVIQLMVDGRNHGSIANEIGTPGDPAREAIVKFMNSAGGE